MITGLPEYYGVDPMTRGSDRNGGILRSRSYSLRAPNAKVYEGDFIEYDGSVDPKTA